MYKNGSDDSTNRMIAVFEMFSFQYSILWMWNFKVYWSFQLHIFSLLL